MGILLELEVGLRVGRGSARACYLPREAKMGNALETPLGSRIVRLSNLTASATQSRRTPNAFSSVTELTQSEPRTEAFRSHPMGPKVKTGTSSMAP